MTDKLYSGSKQLGFVLRAMKTSLYLPLCLFASAWFMLAVTTLMTWVVPQTLGYPQRWWFYGSVHLAASTALLLALQIKGFVLAGRASWVPGWRKAHLQALLVCLGFIVVTSFAFDGLLDVIAGRAGNYSLLPWLIFSIGAAVVFVNFFPIFNGSLFVFWATAINFFLIELLVFAARDSKYFYFVWQGWLLMREWPWLLALSAVVLAGLSLRIDLPNVLRIKRILLTQWWQSSAFEKSLRSGDQIVNRSYATRYRTLFETLPFSAYDTALPVGIWSFFAAFSRSENFAQRTLFEWFLFVLLTGGLMYSLKQRRPAQALFWLPGGLSRQTLGRDMFALQTRRMVVAAAAYAFSIALLQLIRQNELHLANQVQTFILLAAYGVFLAGWATAFKREKTDVLVRAMLLLLPTVIAASALIIGMFLVPGGAALMPVKLQLVLVLLFLAAGWYLGRYKTAHWGQKDVEEFVHAKKLAI